MAAGLFLAGCSSGPKASAPPATGGGVTIPSSRASITISNFMFSPMSTTVAPGATIAVTNKDSTTHTLTATGGQFNTGDIGHNQTKTFKAPMRPGNYPYICNIHQYMTGTITVR